MDLWEQANSHEARLDAMDKRIEELEQLLTRSTTMTLTLASQVKGLSDHLSIVVDLVDRLAQRHNAHADESHAAPRWIQ